MGNSSSNDCGRNSISGGKGLGTKWNSPNNPLSQAYYESRANAYKTCLDNHAKTHSNNKPSNIDSLECGMEFKHSMPRPNLRY
jgi:hypothetical protein